MPKVPFITSKEVIARVIRNLGYHLPSQYHDDMLEWLPEGINQLTDTKLRVVTSTPSCDEVGALETINHIVALPAGLLAIIAVEDEFGHKIPEGGDITDITSPTSRYTDTIAARSTVFGVNPYQHQTSDGTPTTEPGSTIPVYGDDLTGSTPANGYRYYKMSGNYLQTSFETGFVKIHYLAMVVDSEGYPLVPDNENFKTALYWYILKMLIGAGYQHPVFSYQFCDQEFERIGARALGEIKFPSLDEKARVHNANTRLIAPSGFHSNFFIGSEQG